MALKIILIFVILLAFVACSTGNSASKENEITGSIENKFKQFLTVDILEESGFQHLNGNDFLVFSLKNDYFILNSKDHLLVKYNSQKKPLNSYQEKGQGPGGMVDPRSIFQYDTDSLAIFDITKARILLFDFDLNFLKERKVDTNIRKLQKSDEGFIAFGDFGKKIFGIFDKNLNLVETFLEPDRTLPFKGLYPTYLYTGYLLKENIVHTSWLYVKKECVADIFDVYSKKKIVSLKWKHPHPPTQKTITSRTNMYGSYHISKYGKFYITHNRFSKKWKSPSTGDLFIFKKNGKLHSKHPFDHNIIQSNSENDSRLFFFQDEEGIYYLDLNEL